MHKERSHLVLFSVADFPEGFKTDLKEALPHSKRC